MTSRKRISKKFCLFLLAGVLAVDCAYAQQSEREQRDQQRTRTAQAVSREVYDKIQQAEALIDEQDYPGALRILRDLIRSDGLTEYERSNVLNYIGLVYYYLENAPAAIATYEEMLGLPGLELQFRKQSIYTLVQLHMMEEQFDDAIRYLEEWFTLEPDPASEPYILLAQCYYQLNRYKEMIPPVETAIELAKARERTVKEDWYVLLNFAYFQQEDYRRVREIQKILLVTWPKKRYWFWLAGAYTELGDDSNLFAIYDVVHTNGLLESESEFLTMAQLYLQNDIPYKAASLLEAEMESGRVSQTAKNYRLLSQAWSMALEDEKAIPALQEAAKLSSDGEINLRLGNAYLNLGRYEDCAASVLEGLTKGGIASTDNAHISLGMCLYYQQDYEAATNAFREARKTPRSTRISEEWIRVINFDLERNAQIEFAESAAHKKHQELLTRREANDRR